MSMTLSSIQVMVNY